MRLLHSRSWETGLKPMPPGRAAEAAAGARTGVARSACGEVVPLAPTPKHGAASHRSDYPLHCRAMRVSIRALTHSHVPMAHGGYATT
jgi:hypothetical protein